MLCLNNAEIRNQRDEVRITLGLRIYGMMISRIECTELFLLYYREFQFELAS